MPKNNKVKYVKPIYNDCSVNVPLQWDIPKNVDDSKKINPTKIFEGYKKKNNKSKNNKD